MTILYVFPHPDDESFGPAPVMHKMLRQGHNVHLLTLTKGGATKQRHKFNYTVEEMGEVRHKEMLCVEKVLGLTSMTVLDLPDSGLKEMDPRTIENVVRHYVEQIKPEVIVSYPVHGISGFYDHLVMHAVAKRVFVELREQVHYLKRLAFTSPTMEMATKNEHFRLKGLTEKEIDCIVEVEDQDIEATQKALDCYTTYKETIDNSGIRDMIIHKQYFEFFDESFSPPLSDLLERLPK